MAIIYGDDTDNVLDGDTDTRNEFYKNDTIYGLGGNDVLNGGEGHDVLYAHDRDLNPTGEINFLNGGAGGDRLYGDA